MKKLLHLHILYFAILIIFFVVHSNIYAGYGTGGSGADDNWTNTNSVIITTNAADKMAVGTTTANIAGNIVGTATASGGFTTPNFFVVGNSQLNANGILVNTTGDTGANFLNSSLVNGGNVYIRFGKGDALNTNWLRYGKSVNGQSTDNFINLNTSASSGLYIRGSDNYIGVNQSNPTCMFETRETSKGTGTVAMRVNYDNTGLAGSVMVQFTMFTETVVGSIDIVNDTTLAYNTFTGSHYTKVKNRGLKKYMVLESTGETLEGYSQCVETKLSNRIKSKRIIGVYGGKTQHGYGMALSIGTGFVWVKNDGENIDAEDYLCSSNIPGYAQKQNDNIVHNYTVAKATEKVIWKTGEKKKLVACTYHGG